MKLIYVVDPMCSWCYGFAPSVDALLADPGQAAPLELALVMGGLRPYTTEPVSARFVDEILGHWRHVHEASGQPFAAAPHTALHDSGFVYDTEPASRAVVAVRSLWPAQVWRYLKAIQQAFYAGARNVARAEVLADLALAQGLPRSEFAHAFASQQMRDATRADFRQAQDWGIRGFPALLAELGAELHLVSQGYLDADALRERVAALAARGPGSAALH